LYSPETDTRTFDPADMAMRGRIGGYTTHSRHSGLETTAAARSAAFQMFLDEVDPARTLPDDERLRRAQAARSAHMARIARVSALKRKKGVAVSATEET